MIINLHSLLAKCCLQNKKYFYFLFLFFIIFSYGQTPDNTPGVNKTFTVPANVTSIKAEVWGSGGSGGGSSSNNNRGSGAGGGGYTTKTFDVTAGDIITYTVGAGAAAGGAGAVGNNGNASSLTHVSSVTNLLGNGGNRGLLNTGTGGTGGTSSGGSTDTSGSNGGAGGSGTGGNGGDGGNALGTGGAGRNDNNGLPGAMPGGGGGGGERDGGSDKAGGAGANGQVKLTFISVSSVTTPACIGSTITISGTNFAITGTTTVTINGTACTGVNVVNSTTITAVVAVGTTSGTVLVNNPNGTNNGKSITVNPLPTAVTITGTTPACASTTLTASNGGSGTIYWQNTTSNGTSTATPSTSQVVTASGTYYFRALSSDGCWGTQGSITVVIDTPPAAIAGGATSVCAGATTPAFTNSTPGGTWSITNGTGTASITSGGVVTGLTEGDVTVVYTFGTCPAVTKSLTVNSIPTIALSSGAGTNSQTVCINTPIASFTHTIGGTATGVSIVGLPTGVTGNLVGSVYTISGTPTVSGTFNYTITTSGGSCAATATGTITVSAQPVAIAGGAVNVCTGASTPAFTNSTTGGTWSITNGTGTASITSGGVVTGLTAGNVTVVYTIGACSATTVVTVNNTPAAIGGGTATVCTGAVTPAFTNITGGGTWSITNGTGSATITAGGIVTGVSAGSATVMYTIGTCTASVPITVITTPTITTNPTSVSVATGANTSFTVAASNIPTSYTWQVSTNGGASWNNISNGGVYSNATTATLNITGATIGMNGYLYRASATNNCGTSAYSSNATLTVQYCTPTFNTTNTGRLFIKSFKYIGVLNDDFLTTNVSTQSGTNGAYENYTTLTPIGEQLQGSVVNVEAVCGGTIRTPAAGRWVAWVDWNKDGIFASTEVVYQLIAPYLTDAVTFGFQIPTNQTAGNYRLRVAVIQGSSPTTSESCNQSAYYGEMEDYLFKVIEDNLAKLDTTKPNIFNRCEAGVISLTAVKKDNNVVDFKWYDTKYGGTLLYTGATYSPNVTVSTTFYVTAIDINGKETPFRYPFFARIDPKPEVTFTPLPETICGDDDSFLILSVWGDKREEILIDEKFDNNLGEFENVKDVTDTFTDTRNTPAYSPDWRTNPQNPIPHTPKNPPHLAIASSIASGYFGGNFAVINTDVYRNVSVRRHLASKNEYDTTNFLPSSLILDFEMYYFSIAIIEADAYLKVEYSDNGGTWTSFATYNTNQGNPLIWKKISLNLDALGVPRSTKLKIRFSVFSRGYGTSVAYYESIATLDNVKLYGFTPFGRDFDWSGLDNAVLYDEATCSIPLGNTLARKVCIKPSLDDFEKPYWDFSASATFLNGCPANNTTRVYNDTKIWNQPVKTNWTQTNDDWKPNGIPGIKNCVIVRTPVDLTSGNNGFARSVIIKPGGVLNIRSNSNLEVQNHVKNQTTAANFLLESDANLKQNNNTASNEGSITVKRNANLKRLDYNYWGSPVVGQNIKNFSPETIITRFYFYNEANDYFDGIFVNNRYPNGTSSLTPIQNANTYNFETAKGYAIRSSNNYTSALTIFEGNFVGIPNNGIKSYPLAYTDAEHGYNLISNPYPSNIDFDALYTNNSALISQTAYFWTNVNANPAMQANQYPKVGSINNYAVYSGTGGLSAPYGFTGTGTNTPVAATPNNIIKVGQGFIVKAKSAGSLSFRNSIRTKSPGTFFNRMTSTVAKDRYWLELKTPLNFVTPMLIGYVNGGTDQFDLDFDVPLLIQGADTFYSVLEDKNLAIQGRQFPLIQEDVVQLGAVFYDNGVHTISLANKEGIFANEQPIYLHDKQENVFVDLQKSSYTFQAVKGENKERFEIVYKDQFALATDDFEKQNVVVYTGQDSFTVIASDKIVEIAMYDASGKLINKIKPNVTTGKIASSQLSKGVYVLKIKTTKNIITKKVIKN